MASLRQVLTKKNLFIGLIGLLFILIIISITTLLFAILKTDEIIEKSTEVILLENEYKNIYIKNTGQNTLPDETVKKFDLLNSKNSTDEDRYETLIDLVFDLRSGYSIDHAPEARLFITNDLNKYAKSNFPDHYSQDDFDVACLDEACGASINTELQNIIDDIASIDLVYDEEDEEYTKYNREVILGNLTNMALLNESGEQMEVLSLANLVISQLEQDKNNYNQQASLLKKYILDKYKYDYDKEMEILENEYNKELEFQINEPE